MRRDESNVDLEQKEYRKMMVNNLTAKVTHNARRMNNMHVKETEDLVRVDSGIPTYNFNIITLPEQGKTPSKDTIKKEMDHFNDKGFPINMWCWEDEKETREIIHDIGLTEYHTPYIGMVAELKDQQISIQDRDDLILKEISTENEAQQFGNIIANLYENPEPQYIQTYFSKITDLLLDRSSPYKPYVGIYQGEVVSTGSLMFTDTTVGMYDIATIPEVRGKGIGTALIQYLLHDAKENNGEYCVLQASPEGKGIYERAGFQSIGNLKIYENTELVGVPT